MSRLRRFFVCALNVLLSSSCLYLSPDLFDPDGGYSSDGNLVGLLDSKGGTIVPAKYSQVDYAGHGLFIMSSVNEPDPYVRGNERYLFTTAGEEIKVKVPEGGSFRRILWLSDDQLENDAPVQSLPKNTLLTFIKEHRYGICDLDGNQIVEPLYECIDVPHDGVAIMIRRFDLKTELSVFDVHKRLVKALPLKNVCSLFHSDLRNFTYFSEGLAACRLEDKRGYPRYGYIDVDGNVVIEPRFANAGPFVNGIATVSLFEGEQCNFTIDRAGKMISPELLEVKQFRGNYAIAKYRALQGGFGIVNRKFEFVVKPDYGEIHAVKKRRTYSHFLDLKGYITRSPEYYLCGNSVLSGDCRFLFKFPQDCRPNCDDVDENHWGCWKSGSYVYFNQFGKEIPKPKTIEQSSKGSSVYSVAPDRFQLTINTDTGKFDRRYWSLGHDRPISRLTMFTRFLDEYDLIGMNVEELEKFLGPGEKERHNSRPQLPTHSYLLISGYCLPDSAVSVKITVSNGKVESWCFNAQYKDLPLITSNVLIALGEKDTYRVPATIPKYVSGPRSDIRQKVLKPAQNTKL